VSQIILDDQLRASLVLRPIRAWSTVQRLRDLRPGEVIKDERVPTILQELRQPTFVTIDSGFWSKRLRNRHYCIVCFGLRDEQQDQLPNLLRRLFHHPGFHTREARMGKVARVRIAGVDYWQWGDEGLHSFLW
jgi:hypothetical protein